MSNIEAFLERWAFLVAFGILIIGLLVIVVPLFILPFNDWSFSLNPELSSSYGNFIGGLVGTLFSITAIILLYLTLTTQQKALAKQSLAFDEQIFESSLFNLLKLQNDITKDLAASFRHINKETLKPVGNKVVGRSCFYNTKNELIKIYNALECEKFLGCYDYEHISQEDESFRYYDFNNPEMMEEYDKFVNECKIRYTNMQYGINEKVMSHYKEQNLESKLKIVYSHYYNKYHPIVGHYYRHLYHIIKFVVNSSTNFPDKEKFIKKHIDFIQSQMSSFELLVMYYNSFAFPKMLELIKATDFLENLAVEDLIDKSHSSEALTLKSRHSI